MVGRACGVSQRADECVRDIERRIAAVRRRVGGRPAPRVLALEWLEPPFVPGHWVPEKIALAGAVPLRGTAPRPSLEIGRASCRGRVEILVGARFLKKKIT